MSKYKTGDVVQTHIDVGSWTVLGTVDDDGVQAYLCENEWGDRMFIHDDQIKDT